MAVLKSDEQYAAALRELRKKHKVIQYALAGKLGLETQQQYSDLEKGKKHFTDEIIINICDYFQISILDFVHHSHNKKPDYFLSDEDYKEINEAKTNEIKLTLYKKLFLETKIENVEVRLKTFRREIKTQAAQPGKYKIHVII